MLIAITGDASIHVNLGALTSFMTTGDAFVVQYVPGELNLPAVMNFDEEITALQARKQARFDAHIFVTAKPFDNNFFYSGIDGTFILSLHEWEELTDLPYSNGIAYFICQIAVKYILNIGISHDMSRGCINDFMWDKSIVDAGMRAAFLCAECERASNRDSLKSPEFVSIKGLLDSISLSSRQGQDVLELQAQRSQKREFDIFLCHNSDDKPQVRELNTALGKAGIKTWFDEETLLPGKVWQDELEEQIGLIGSCAVIVGENGQGPWHEMERRAFIDEFARRRCQIIPVLVGSGTVPPKLPLFLRAFTWADLRSDSERNLERLVRAILERR